MGIIEDFLSEVDYAVWNVTHPFSSSQIASSSKIPSAENKKPEHIKAIPGISTPSQTVIRPNIMMDPIVVKPKGETEEKPEVNKPDSIARETERNKEKTMTDNKPEYKDIVDEAYTNMLASMKRESAMKNAEKNYKMEKIRGGERIVDMVALFVLEDFILDDAIDNEAKCIANAIGSIYGLGKLYNDAGTIPDLRVYDPSYTNYYRPELGYDVSISYILSYKNSSSFAEALEEKLAEHKHTEKDTLERKYSNKPYDFSPKKPDYHYGEKTIEKPDAEPSAIEIEKTDVEEKIEYVYTVKNPKKPESKMEEPKQEDSTKEEPKKEDTVKQQSTIGIMSALFSGLNETVQKRKANKGNALLKEVVNYIMFSNCELYQNHSIESKKIINGIGSVFGLKELYSDVLTADIRMYDPTFEATGEYNPDLDTIVYISDIVKWKNDPDFKTALEKKLEESGYSAGLDDFELENIGGINETSDVNTVRVQDGFPIALKDVFEPFFADKNVRRTYFFDANRKPNILVDHINLNQHNSYIIDDNHALGRDFISIMCKSGQNDSWFVPIICKEVIDKIFSDPDYLLTVNDIHISLQYYFGNPEIYKYIDMSDPRFLNKLTTEQFKKLGRKLTYIIDTIMRNMTAPGTEMPGLRFLAFVNINRFSLISDSQVGSSSKYISGSGYIETSPTILEGLTFIVKDDTITRQLNGVEDKFNITEDYNAR